MEHKVSFTNYDQQNIWRAMLVDLKNENRMKIKWLSKKNDSRMKINRYGLKLDPCKELSNTKTY